MSDNQRTRPSEAEVIAKVTEAFVVELRAEWADAGCKTPMQVDGGCDCPDCVLANTVCAALDLVIQHRATPPLAPEVTAEKVALIEALRDAMKVGVPEGSNATEAIRWLTAALSTPPLPSAEPKYAWVIVDSRYPAPDLRYYNGVGSNELGKGWTPNHMKAIRFCRNVDADAALMSLPHGWHLVGAVEQHGWSAFTTPPLPSAEPVHEGDGLTWTEFRNHVARVLADAGQHGLRVAFLRRCFTDTTRPPPRRKPRAD